MPIITCGFILTNGMFIPTIGGHAKTANRICGMYKELEELKNQSILNSDEFLITAGCGIIAAYRGERFFKVASDNISEKMKMYAEQYAKIGFKIMPFWNIDEEAYCVLEKSLKMQPKMQIRIIKEL